MNRENIKNILDKTNISVVDEIHILEYIEQLEQVKEEYTKSLDKLDQLENKIYKAIEYIKGTHFYGSRTIGKSLFNEYFNNLLDILRGEE